MPWQGLFRNRHTAAHGDAQHNRMETLGRQCAEIAAELKALRSEVAELSRRHAQVRALLARNADLEPYQERLQGIIAKATTGAHIARSIRRADLQTHPFPHAIVDDVVPDDLYGALLRGLPPLDLFSDKPVNKQYLQVPFVMAPSYSQRVWCHMASTVVPDFIVPAVLEKFKDPIDEWISANWPQVPSAAISMHSSDGRILLRRRGYRIPPHRDPKWGFITCIVYLARKQDSEAWGTALYTVDNDDEARGAAPHWIDAARCRLVTEVAFRPNRMLVLLNSVGAHGAHIPADAEPETLERYIYQFRIAPTVDSMALLKSSLSDERKPFWAGKSADY